MIVLSWLKYSKHHSCVSIVLWQSMINYITAASQHETSVEKDMNVVCVHWVAWFCWPTHVCFCWTVVSDWQILFKSVVIDKEVTTFIFNIKVMNVMTCFNYIATFSLSSTLFKYLETGYNTLLIFSTSLLPSVFSLRLLENRLSQEWRTPHQWQVSIFKWDSSKANSRCRIEKSTSWQLWEVSQEYKIK